MVYYASYDILGFYERRLSELHWMEGVTRGSLVFYELRLSDR